MSQLLGRKGLQGSFGLTIEIYEMADAEVVDIGIVGDALL